MFKKIVLGVIDIIGIMYLACISYMYIGTLPVDKNDESTTTIVYALDSSRSQEADLKQLAVKLKEENVIRSAGAFYWKSFFIGEYYNYIPGEYEIAPCESADDIMRQLMTGSEYYQPEEVESRKGQSPWKAATLSRGGECSWPPAPGLWDHF